MLSEIQAREALYYLLPGPEAVLCTYVIIASVLGGDIWGVWTNCSLDCRA